VIENNQGTMLTEKVFPYRPMVQSTELTTNEVTSRRELLKSLLDPRRDINYECGYPETETISVRDYKQMYERESVGTRVVVADQARSL
jgi:hypothetical protein